jgi:hypothetical protein
MAALLACPACNCHFRAGEPECPHCGAAVAREVKKLGRTAGSIALGLVAVYAPFGCEHPSSGVGGAGGSTSYTVAVHTSVASTYGCGPLCNGGSPHSSSATVTTGDPCDSIGVCSDPSMMGDPTMGCADCALTQGNVYSDEGGCLPQETAAYGMDAMCMMGGYASICAYGDCLSKCANAPIGNGNLNLDTQAEWDCVCTNTKMGATSTCLPASMQTDANTCFGKLAADTAALHALNAFDQCLLGATTGACKVSCQEYVGLSYP